MLFQLALLAGGLVALVLLFWLLYFGFSAVCLLARVAIRTHNELLSARRKLAPCRAKAILVTGATSGLGLALAKYFHRQGFTVLACFYSRQEAGYQQLAALADRLHLVELDVTSEQSIADSCAAVERLLAAEGAQLHALINNAGLSTLAKTQWLSRGQLRAVVETNLLGPMLMVRQYLPLLARAPGGRVLDVSSFLAFYPSQFCALYGATKAGLAYYTYSLAIDLRSLGVKTVVLYPGNLIRNTAILAACADQLAAMEAEFSPEERRLFGPEFEQHRKLAASTAASVRRYQQRQQQRPAPGRAWPWARALVGRLFDYALGKIPDGLALEDSAAMHSFDNAVRLPDPPMEMFVGNQFYNIVMAAHTEVVTYVWRRVLGLMFARHSQRLVSI